MSAAAASASGYPPQLRALLSSGADTFSRGFAVKDLCELALKRGFQVVELFDGPRGPRPRLRAAQGTHDDRRDSGDALNICVATRVGVTSGGNKAHADVSGGTSALFGTFLVTLVPLLTMHVYRSLGRSLHAAVRPTQVSSFSRGDLMYT